MNTLLSADCVVVVVRCASLSVVVTDSLLFVVVGGDCCGDDRSLFAVAMSLSLSLSFVVRRSSLRRRYLGRCLRRCVVAILVVVFVVVVVVVKFVGAVRHCCVVVMGVAMNWIPSLWLVAVVADVVINYQGYETRLRVLSTLALSCT